MRPLLSVHLQTAPLRKPGSRLETWCWLSTAQRSPAWSTQRPCTLQGEVGGPATELRATLKPHRALVRRGESTVGVRSSTGGAKAPLPEAPFNTLSSTWYFIGIKSCFCPHVPSVSMASNTSETRKWPQNVLYWLQTRVLKLLARKNRHCNDILTRRIIYRFSSFLPPVSSPSLTSLFPPLFFSFLSFHQFLE